MARPREWGTSFGVPAPQSDQTSPQGGEDSLVQAYMARRANLIRFFAARTGSPAAAEDLAQELYLKLAGRPPGEAAENPMALIYRIAFNLMLDRARGEARSAARDAQWRGANRTTIAGEDVAEDVAADEVAASRQRLRQLVEAVAELPPQMQRAFTLHKLEGRSHAETAQAMGISVKSVEKHISAALKNLSARLSA
ncbi:MAG: polymerase sigma-70 factor, subfamily [Phenylobacterium sp.]|nr:polymerase sigma-70 factor, subfamily [Phenylobacterium sp.]